MRALFHEKSLLEILHSLVKFMLHNRGGGTSVKSSVSSYSVSFATS